MENEEPKSSYDNRTIWRLIALYLSIGLVVYGLFYYFVITKKDDGSYPVFQNSNTSNQKEIQLNQSISPETLPLAEEKLPEGSLSDLCDSINDCIDYCAENIKKCLEFCDNIPDNSICKELNSVAKQTGPAFLFDPNKESLPKLAVHNFIDLQRIVRISKFRGGYGHDYSQDTGETCRSMKHYFWPDGTDPGKAGASWSNITYYAPADGTIWRLQGSRNDAQFSLRAKQRNAFSFRFHHINLASDITDGVEVKAGQKLGTIAANGSMGEIAVEAITTNGYMLLSFFEVAAPSVFEQYAARGLSSPEEVIITKDQRDKYPLKCDPNTPEGRFLGGSIDGLTDSAGLPNWVDLR